MGSWRWRLPWSRRLDAGDKLASSTGLWGDLAGRARGVERPSAVGVTPLLDGDPNSLPLSRRE